MPRLVIAACLLAVLSARAAEPAPDRDTLRKAFDGAMTCSAITAILAEDKPPAESWRWKNRSFAFGMFAAQIWSSVAQQPMSMEELDHALGRYAESLLELLPEERDAYEARCAEKYPDFDKLCEVNDCPHTPPPSRDG